MFNNPYMNSYNSQANIDRINAQMKEIEKLKQQIQQPIQSQMPTNLTQNFQLAPSNRDVIRYAASIEEVQRDMVIGAYQIHRQKNLFEKDNKDLQIEYLQAQIEQLKKGMKKYESNTNVINAASESVEDEESTNVSNVSKSTKKSKWPKRNDK